MLLHPRRLGLIKRAVHARMLLFNLYLHKWVVGMIVALTLDYLVEMMPREMLSFLEFYRTHREPVDLPQVKRLRWIVRRTYSKTSYRNAKRWTDKSFDGLPRKIPQPTNRKSRMVDLTQRERAALHEVVTVARASGNDAMVSAMNKLLRVRLNTDVEELGMRGKTSGLHANLSTQDVGGGGAATTSDGGEQRSDVAQDDQSHG